MENWNRNDWQGRRKDQYESSAKIMTISFFAIIAISAACLIYMSLV